MLSERSGWWTDLRRLLSVQERRSALVLLGLSAASTTVEVAGAAAVFGLLSLLQSSSLTFIVPVLGTVELSGRMAPERARVLLAAGLLAFFVLRAGFLVVRAYAEARIVTTLSVRVSERLLSGYLAMPYEFHTQRNSSDLVRNTFTSTQALANHLNSAVLLVTNVVLTIGLAGLLVATDPVISAVAGVTLGLSILLIQRRLLPRLTIWGRLAHEATEGSLRTIQQALASIRDIKLLGRSDWFTAEHTRHRVRLARSGYLSAAGGSLPRSAIELGLVSTVVLALVVVTLSGDDMTTALPTLGLFAYAGVRIQPALQLVITARNSLRYAGPIVRGLVEDQALIERWRADVATIDPAVSEEPPAFTELRLESVTFRYGGDPETRPVLIDVDLAIGRGEFVGICGPTGGGKSTLLDVLTGLLSPTTGRVVVDGIALAAEPAWWWRCLGVVSQQTYLVDDTLRSNIAFGIPPGLVDDARVARAAEIAQLAGLLADLPVGLDTIVGEGGVRLSGGQRQRVGLARALYRDTPVLVLDEGTSALDTVTETAVMHALRADEAPRTLIAVAHRLSTIRDADRILVVEGGRIVAEGRWDELARSNQAFRRLNSTSGDTAPAIRIDPPTIEN